MECREITVVSAGLIAERIEADDDRLVALARDMAGRGACSDCGAVSIRVGSGYCRRAANPRPGG